MAQITANIAIHNEQEVTYALYFNNGELLEVTTLYEDCTQQQAIVAVLEKIANEDDVSDNEVVFYNANQNVKDVIRQLNADTQQDVFIARLSDKLGELNVQYNYK